jgi:hypothetical protein
VALIAWLLQEAMGKICSWPYDATKIERHVRKQIKRNRKPKPVRSKNCLRSSLTAPGNWDDLEALDEFSLPHTERVMPRGERERRRAVLEMALVDMADEDEAPELWPEEVPRGETEQRRKGIVTACTSTSRVAL